MDKDKIKEECIECKNSPYGICTKHHEETYPRQQQEFKGEMMDKNDIINNLKS